MKLLGLTQNEVEWLKDLAYSVLEGQAIAKHTNTREVLLFGPIDEVYDDGNFDAGDRYEVEMARRVLKRLDPDIMLSEPFPITDAATPHPDMLKDALKYAPYSPPVVFEQPATATPVPKDAGDDAGE